MLCYNVSKALSMFIDNISHLFKYSRCSDTDSITSAKASAVDVDAFCAVYIVHLATRQLFSPTGYIYA